MEAFLQEILKHTSKISKILTRVSELHPDLSSELDLALYSAIKIQKVVRKCSDLHLKEDVVNTDLMHSSDPIFDAAMRNIESFRQATSKLDSKINIMVNQSEQRHRPHFKRRIPEQLHPSRPYVASHLSSEPEQNPPIIDRSLNQIDNSIIKITKQIITEMRNSHESQQSREHSFEA